jgi:hypothetical protein
VLSIADAVPRPWSRLPIVAATAGAVAGAGAGVPI